MTLKYLPWGDDVTFDWDEYNENEIWKHGVRDFEVEECFENEYFVIPHPKWKSEPKKYEHRYVIKGSTHGGRKLLIIVQHIGGNFLRVVTVWDN